MGATQLACLALNRREYYFWIQRQHSSFHLFVLCRTALGNLDEKKKTKFVETKQEDTKTEDEISLRGEAVYFGTSLSEDDFSV